MEGQTLFKSRVKSTSSGGSPKRNVHAPRKTLQYDNKDWKSQLRDEAVIIGHEQDPDQNLLEAYKEVFKSSFAKEFELVLNRVNRKSGECLEKARNVSLLPWRN